MKLLPNLSEIEQSAAELLQFEYLPRDLEHVSRIPLCSGIICTVFKLSQPVRNAVTLTCDPLTLKLCGRSGITWLLSVVNLSKIGQSAAEILII